MTGQDLLDRMELLNAELQLQSGEVDVAKGLLALNVAQDFFETFAATHPDILGSTVGTLTVSASTETTAFPTGVLRIDRLQLLNSSSRVEKELRRIKRAGGHAATFSWPISVLAGTSSGVVEAYWTNGTNVYWQPFPSETRTVRWYGFQIASNITASGTFAYPDIVALPLASFACRVLKSGLDDSVNDLASLAQESFKGVLDILSNFDRDGATGFEYSVIHTE